MGTKDGKTFDAVVIGGGIIGCSIAFELAKRKIKVAVIEKGEIGKEASWASAGILSAPHIIHLQGNLSTLIELGKLSYKLYPELIRDLKEWTKIDVEYSETGMLHVLPKGKNLEFEHKHYIQNGFNVEKLTKHQLLKAEPLLSPGLVSALFIKEVSQIRPPRFMKVLAEACEKKGVQFFLNNPVLNIIKEKNRVIGVKTRKEKIFSETTIIAAGSWSGTIGKFCGISIPVKPIRGQIVLTETSPNSVHHIIIYTDGYLVPRLDGKLLIGSTAEDVGFVSEVSLEGIYSILNRARHILSSFEKFPVVKLWAGLRPGSPGNMPFIGEAAGMKSLLLACGHFRSGILLAPITAKLIAELVTRSPLSFNLEPFSLP